MATQERLWHRRKCNYLELEDVLNQLSGHPFYSVIDIMSIGNGEFCILYIDTQVASRGTFVQPLPEPGAPEEATGEEPLSQLTNLDKL